MCTLANERADKQCLSVCHYFKYNFVLVCVITSHQLVEKGKKVEG